MKPFIHFEDIKQSFQKLLARFPIETVVVIAVTAIIMYSIHTEIYIGWVPRAIYALIVTFFFLMATTLYRESREARKWDILLPLIPIIYGIGFYAVNSYAGNNDPQAVIFFILHVLGIGFAILITPYIREINSAKAGTIQYSNYFTHIAWVKIMSGIVGVSVLLLGFIAIGSVTELFDLSGSFFREKIYGYWATIAIALITPIYALIHFPVLSEIKRDTYDTNRFFSFLVRFVGIPFILLYFVILYAYSVRVLMNFHDWPNGMISWMVIGFSIFGYLIYVFAEPYAEESKIIAPFREYFPFAVLPQILMLFYAIYLRIAQYDLTMNRYFVVVFGLWLTIISLYYAFGKRKIILFLPATLTLISILISFGPWGVFSLPLDRQYDRFMTNIEKAGLLRDGKIVKLDKKIDATLENEIISEVRYICSFRSCEKLRPYFSETLDTAEKESREKWETYDYPGKGAHQGLTNWEATTAIQTAMGLEYRTTNAIDRNGRYVNLSVDYNQRSSYYPLNLSGYQSLVQVFGTGVSAPSKTFISINAEQDALTIRDGVDTETLSLSGITAGLYAKYGDTSSYEIAQSDLIFTLTGAKHEVRLFLDSYSYRNPNYTGKSDKMRDDSPVIGGMALIKKR